MLTDLFCLRKTIPVIDAYTCNNSMSYVGDVLEIQLTSLAGWVQKSSARLNKSTVLDKRVSKAGEIICRLALDQIWEEMTLHGLFARYERGFLQSKAPISILGSIRWIRGLSKEAKLSSLRAFCASFFGELPPEHACLHETLPRCDGDQQQTI